MVLAVRLAQCSLPGHEGTHSLGPEVDAEPGAVGHGNSRVGANNGPAGEVQQRIGADIVSQPRKRGGAAGTPAWQGRTA